MTSSDEDREFYARLRAGDKSACDACVKKYWPLIYRLALRLTEDEAEAEDVTQETFFRAFKAIDSFEWRSEISTWLYRIAYNTAMSRHRKGGRYDKVSMDELTLRTDSQHIPPQLYDWCCLPERDFDSAEMQFHLEKAIENLPEKFKSVFVLRVLEGLSTREVANTLSITEHNVKTRLRRSRLWLQERLSEHLDVPPI